MTTDEDAALLAGLRSRRRAVRRVAEHTLFERYRDPVARLLRRMLGDDTDDCTQEVFVDIFRGLEGFEGKARLSTWIYRVALRRAWKCVAVKRRQAKERGEDPDAVEKLPAPHAPTDVPEALAADELARRFGDALQRLDIEQRSVMALSALDGLGPSEIAEVLGVPVGTVHSRTSRARARLRELLGV